MNNNDAFAPLMAPEFSGNGDQPAFERGLSEPRQRADFYGEPAESGRREGVDEDGLHATRIARRW